MPCSGCVSSIPRVKVVVMRSGKNRVFCAGANIRMLAGATHAHKVNFCKFTNETRNGLEDSSGEFRPALYHASSTAPRPAAAMNWRSRPITSSSPTTAPPPWRCRKCRCLAVLPGTGGLTRVVDKRKVRRDHADYFCTIEEGIKGKRAVKWRLVDEIVPNSKLEAKVAERAKEFASASKRNGNGKGIALTPLTRQIDDNGIRYGLVSVDIDRAQRIATISIPAPEAAPPADIDGHDRARRLVLAAAGGARARRRHPAFAHQRARDRDAGVQVAWRARSRAGLRRLPRSQQGALAGQRDQALLEAGA